MDEHDFYRRRAQKRLIGIGVLIVVALGAYWYLSQSDSFQKIAAIESSAQHFAAQETLKTFSAPPPLVATTTQEGSPHTLTRAGVITDTNAARQMNGGFSALKENATLDDIASLRLDDMFAKQYFAHVSPASSSAETVAKATGYEYLALGENLALGTFDGDQGVVTAWMNSPGHRENILNSHYTEIGVAVREGLFQGGSAWIAVQIFGRPAADCPLPDPNIRAGIDSAQSQVAAMGAQLKAMQTEIAAINPKSGDAYNKKISDYNALADQYNALVAQTKTKVASYNAEVSAYNQCLGS